jgi:hypothetical protein
MPQWLIGSGNNSIRMRHAATVFICSCVVFVSCRREPREGGGRAPDISPEDARRLIQEAAPRVARSDQPDIKFDVESQDLGTIFQMGTYKCSFKFKNAGATRLAVERATSSCGCAAPVLSERELDPGEEASLDVELKSEMAEGPVVRNLMVKSNDPDEPIKRLTIKANIVPKLPVKPKAVYFRKVRKSERPTVNLEVGPPKVERISSVEVKSTTEHFTHQLLPVDRQEGRYRVEVAIADQVPLGRSAGWLEFFLNGETEPCARVRVTAYVVGDIEVEPERLTFRAQRGAETDLSPLRVTSGTDTTFRVLDVKSDVPVLRTELVPIEQGKQYSVVARLSPDAAAGQVRGKVTIRTDNPEQPEIVVHVFGVIQ